MTQAPRLGRAAELEARQLEGSRVSRLAWGVAGVVLALGALAEDRGRHGRLTAGSEHTTTAWATSLLVMGVFLVALQLVAVLLVLENLVDAQRKPVRWGVGFAAMWVVRLAIILGMYVVVVWADPTDHLSALDRHTDRTWTGTGDLLLILEAIVLALLLVLRSGPLLRWALGEPVATLSQLPELPELPELPAASSATAAPDSRTDRLLAIGASGGGIRASAFVLGGHEATQDARVGLGIDEPEHEPHIFAVSGGSYMAAAMALRRVYRIPDEAASDLVTDRRTEPAPPDPFTHDPATPWASTYSRDSAELQRLRRNTRYLFEPAGKLRNGVVTLLIGAALNLFLLGATVRFVVWLSTQLSVMLRLLTLDRLSGGGSQPVYHLHDRTWQILGVPVACVVLVLALTLVGWFAASGFDGHDVDRTDQAAMRSRRRSMETILRTGTLRATLFIAGLGWLLLVFVVPGATAGIARAATDNHPTAHGATILTALGLVDERTCEASLREHVQDAVTHASSLARLNPGVEAKVSAGACGAEIDVRRTYDPDTAAVPDADLSAREEKAIADYVASTPFDVRVQVAGIGVMITLVGGLLRRATAAPSAKPGRFAAIRARLLTFLPLTLMGLVLFYLSLLWTRGLLAGVSGSYLTYTAAMTLLACVIAFLVDANVTSMHRFYRGAVANAFSAGVSDDGTRAEELPTESIYRFSELQSQGGGPRLHIVTTLNTQAPGESPTLRRGLPMVFAPDAVSLHRSRTDSAVVPAGDYERFAGPGRVSVMATVGISGAAVSPLMGRFNEQMAPYRLLIALFNLRLGTWTRNPAHTPNPADRPTPRPWWRGPGVLWMTDKPGLAQMVLEAAGNSSERKRWVYLSDGGHLDNTALVECARFAQASGAQGRILVLDASNDVTGSWSAVGDAIAVVRADLGIDLVREPHQGEPPWMRHYTGGGLDVLAVKAVRLDPPKPGKRSVWWDRLSPDIQSFLVDHPDFPRSSTARQKFGDLEFEAYRELGYVAASSAFEVVGWTPEPAPAPTPDTVGP